MQVGFSDADLAFRDEVRAFLDRALTPELREAGRLTTSVFTDRTWSQPWHEALYRQGWVAPSWPVEYGGAGWNEVQRYIFAAECTAAGAPNLAPMGLRMCGPVLMGYGTPEQKAYYLPRILSGEDYWCQGYSEPGSGSDLASLQLRAESDSDDYVLNGSKIWTTHAQFANRMFCLVRTSSEGRPQQGITFLLLDMDTPGITIRPIINLAGSHDFNEVVFQDVFVPEDMRVGGEGDGWKQVTTELAFERSGPERYLSSIALVLALIDHVASSPDPRATEVVGRLVAHLSTLRQMSLSVAGMLQAGQNPNLEAAVVKDVGTTFEQSVPEVVHALMDIEPTIDSGSDLQQTLGYLVQRAPSFSLRGGTREVLRGIIARGLGLR
jgi:acyl-CoA dehydrogenase